MGYREKATLVTVTAPHTDILRKIIRVLIQCVLGGRATFCGQGKITSGVTMKIGGSGIGRGNRGNGRPRQHKERTTVLICGECPIRGTFPVRNIQLRTPSRHYRPLHKLHLQVNVYIFKTGLLGLPRRKTNPHNPTPAFCPHSPKLDRTYS